MALDRYVKMCLSRLSCWCNRTIWHWWLNDFWVWAAAPTGKLHCKKFPPAFHSDLRKVSLWENKLPSLRNGWSLPTALAWGSKPRLGHISGRPSKRKSLDIVATCCCNSQRISPVAHKVWSVQMLGRWLRLLRSLGDDGDGRFGDLLCNTFWGVSNSKCSRDVSLPEA